MNSKHLRIIVFILLCWAGQHSQAQVVIRPMALNNPFFKFEQLFQIQLLNTSSEAINGLIQVQLIDKQGGAIFQMNSLPLSLKKGATINSGQINWEGGLSLASQALSSTLHQFGRLTSGQYSYCYRFINQANGRTLGSHCQESTTINFQLPALVYPQNSQSINTPFPVLSWRPPMPLFGAALNYSLRLVALQEGQSRIDAIHSNLPLLEKYNLKTIALPYPPTTIPLQKDQQYAWQVTAYWQSVEIGKTEIWQFSLTEPINNKGQKPISFRLAKRKMGAAYYVFSDKEIPFGYDNYEAATLLNYKIYPKNKPNHLLANLPKIALKPGLNQLTLKVDNRLKLKHNESYILEIINKKGTSFFLGFKYKKK